MYLNNHGLWFFGTFVFKNKLNDIKCFSPEMQNVSNKTSKTYLNNFIFTPYKLHLNKFIRGPTQCKRIIMILL